MAEEQDVTPGIVEAFLPGGVLPEEHVQPVHLLLDRYDGRTKDYLVSQKNRQAELEEQYVEVASMSSARLVLNMCQNAFMPSGRIKTAVKRPVTVSIVPHRELIEEVRAFCAAKPGRTDHLSYAHARLLSCTVSSASAKRH